MSHYWDYREEFEMLTVVRMFGWDLRKKGSFVTHRFREVFNKWNIKTVK
jgi:hypothetical protein